jgi:transcriptional repressor NrdR
VEKRPVSAETVEAMVARIIHKLQTIGEREIPARELGDLVMEELRSVDEVAYVRFASVYRSFQDVTQFEDEIRKLQQMPSPAARRDQLSLLPRDRGDGKGKKK